MQLRDRSSIGRRYRPDLGSFWISAEALTGDRILRSPGLAAPDKNLSPSVFRISVRKDDSYLVQLRDRSSIG